MENVFLIVGLGNPGAEYARTRHNAGFLLVEELADRWQTTWDFERKFNARLARADRDGKRFLLCEPQTFMNASGDAVGAVQDFYRVSPARLLVVVDDADLALGRIRLRAEGSSGGHHGLESVEARLATRDYARQRIGIGRQDAERREITGHVLGRFSPAEWATMRKVLSRAGDQVECWARDGLGKAMSQFNGAVERPA